MTDDDAPDGASSGTWTRSQLLEHRGYPPEIVARNGHTPTVEPTRAADDTRVSSAPTCRGCGKALTGHQSAWCSTACRERGKRQARRSPRADSTLPVAVTNGTARSQSSGLLSDPHKPGTPPHEPTGWPAMLEALEAVGAQVRTLDLTLGAHRWHLERADR
jgi:hypothetical protein